MEISIPVLDYVHGWSEFFFQTFYTIAFFVKVEGSFDNIALLFVPRILNKMSYFSRDEVCTEN